jgi:hypothetical protein
LVSPIAVAALNMRPFHTREMMHRTASFDPVECGLREKRDYRIRIGKQTVHTLHLAPSLYVKDTDALQV